MRQHAPTHVATSLSGDRQESLDRLAWLALGLRKQRGQVPTWTLLPARLFAGATFLYAGLQKFSDPQFFSPTAPGFIGRQMSGFVHAGSPLSPLLTRLAIPHAAQFGAIIALCEVLVGISALAGLLSRAGALGGLALSLTLYLTASWTVHPYFLGADLPYGLVWLTLLLAGPGPYTLDEYFFGAVLRDRATAPPAVIDRRGRVAVPARPALGEDPLVRRAFLRGMGSAIALGAGGLILSGVAKLRTPNRIFTAASKPIPAATPAAAAPAGAPTTPPAPPGTTYLGNVRVLPVNSAGGYTDPISGDPALLIHLPDGHFVAYDAVCTHAGCTVQYDPAQHQLVCPCHGAVYDPQHGAQVLAGPAPQPLNTLQVTIDAKGNAFAKA